MVPQKKVWWQCHTCGHEWECYLSNRRKQYKYPGQKGTECKNCIGKIVNKENCFAAIRPEMVEEWHPTKNLLATPHNTLSTSSTKAHWICKICEHEWEATFGSRASGAGCSPCGQFKNRELTVTKKWTALNRNIVLVSKRDDHGE